MSYGLAVYDSTSTLVVDTTTVIPRLIYTAYYEVVYKSTGISYNSYPISISRDTIKADGRDHLVFQFSQVRNYNYPITDTYISIGNLTITQGSVSFNIIVPQSFSLAGQSAFVVTHIYRI